MPRKRRARDPEVFRATARDSMRDWLEDCLQKLPDLEIRRMFGGAGIYSEDTMFGILHEGRVYLKTDARTREQYLARGMAPFQPWKGLVLKRYYEVPSDAPDDDSELLVLARQALEVARR